MQNSIELSSKARDLDLTSTNDVELIKKRSEFTNVLEKVLDKGATYAIKAMPVNDHIKDILLDVKKSLKTKDFKEILDTAVNSSIREGLEILSLPKSTLKDIKKIKSIAIEGGLRESLSAGVEIFSKKYLGKNVHDDSVKDFFNEIDTFVKSADFSTKLSTGLEKCENKIDDFKNSCKEWYDAYENFDLNLINKIASNLDKKKTNVEFDEDCVSENNVIQNMTRFINNKKDKLSEFQVQICNSL